MKFKIGDIVTSVKPESSDNLNVGLVGVVNNLYPGKPYPYSIDVDGMNYLFTEDELDFLVDEPVKVDMTALFSRADHIRVTSIYFL